MALRNGVRPRKPKAVSVKGMRNGVRAPKLGLKMPRMMSNMLRKVK
jgi:hypothetical protein